MNELLKSKLEIIVNDDLLLQAIRAVFDETIDKEKPEIGKEQDNNLLGEKYRAYEVAKEMIRKGFTDLMSYKVNKGQHKGFNKGR
jgi:hypothetical protein